MTWGQTVCVGLGSALAATLTLGVTMQGGRMVYNRWNEDGRPQPTFQSGWPPSIVRPGPRRWGVPVHPEHQEAFELACISRNPAPPYIQSSVHDEACNGVDGRYMEAAPVYTEVTEDKGKEASVAHGAFPPFKYDDGKYIKVKPKPELCI